MLPMPSQCIVSPVQPHTLAGAYSIPGAFSPMQVSDAFPARSDAAYQYSEVLHKSFLFYFQQRSGKLPHQVHITHRHIIEREL